MFNSSALAVLRRGAENVGEIPRSSAALDGRLAAAQELKCCHCISWSPNDPKVPLLAEQWSRDESPLHRAGQPEINVEFGNDSGRMPPATLQHRHEHFGLIAADLRDAAICAIMAMRDRRDRPRPDLRQDHCCRSAASPNRTFTGPRSIVQDPKLRSADNGEFAAPSTKVRFSSACIVVTHQMGLKSRSHEKFRLLPIVGVHSLLVRSCDLQCRAPRKRIRAKS